MNVGWLAPEHEYAVGEVDDGIFWGLLWLAARKWVNPTRGLHGCYFCRVREVRIDTEWDRTGHVLRGPSTRHLTSSPTTSSSTTTCRRRTSPWECSR